MTNNKIISNNLDFIDSKNKHYNKLQNIVKLSNLNYNCLQSKEIINRYKAADMIISCFDSNKEIRKTNDFKLLVLEFKNEIEFFESNLIPRNEEEGKIKYNFTHESLLSYLEIEKTEHEPTDTNYLYYANQLRFNGSISLFDNDELFIRGVGGNFNTMTEHYKDFIHTDELFPIDRENNEIYIQHLWYKFYYKSLMIHLGFLTENQYMSSSFTGNYKGIFKLLNYGGSQALTNKFRDKGNPGLGLIYTTDLFNWVDTEIDFGINTCSNDSFKNFSSNGIKTFVYTTLRKNKKSYSLAYFNDANIKNSNYTTKNGISYRYENAREETDISPIINFGLDFDKFDNQDFFRRSYMLGLKWLDVLREGNSLSIGLGRQPNNERPSHENMQTNRYFEIFYKIKLSKYFNVIPQFFVFQPQFDADNVRKKNMTSFYGLKTEFKF